MKRMLGVTILVLIGCAGGGERAPRAADPTIPCTVAIQPPGDVEWRQVSGDAFTFCVPEHWRSAGPREWRGDGVTLAWGKGVPPRELKTVTVTGPAGQIPQPGDLVPGARVDRRIERIGGHAVEVWESEFLGERRAGAQWTTPVSMYMRAELSSSGAIAAAFAIIRSVRFAGVPRDAAAQEPGEISPEAREYLEQALQIMQSGALNREKVDWAQIRATAFRVAAGARTTGDTHRAITGALWALEDGHSRFIPPVAALPEEIRTIMTAPPRPEPEARRIDDRVGYVRVPAFSGPDPGEFARAIADLVFEVDGPDVCAWIVDVRGNTGGNMWPMLQGLSPILGEGVPGYFVAPNGSWTPWRVNTSVIGQRTLALGHPAVAVLQDGETASSGEAVVVAFRGRPDTRSFGQGTAGLSTANTTIPMADGAKMLLTVAVFADRNRDTLGSVIDPDAPLPVDVPEERLLTIVTDWLHQRPACLAR